LKNAFQDTLAKVSSSSAKSNPGAASADSSEEEIMSNETNGVEQLSGSGNSGDRFSQQQPLVHTSASRPSFLPSLPAASAIPLIPVTEASAVSESYDSHTAFQESADVRQVRMMSTAPLCHRVQPNHLVHRQSHHLPRPRRCHLQFRSQSHRLSLPDFMRLTLMSMAHLPRRLPFPRN
jgi:hypothetical protein